MYGENTKTIAIPIYRVLPYPVMIRMGSGSNSRRTIILFHFSIYLNWKQQDEGIKLRTALEDLKNNTQK